MSLGNEFAPSHFLQAHKKTNELFKKTHLHAEIMSNTHFITETT